MIAILEVAIAEDRLLVEWSSHEELVVEDAELSPHQSAVFFKRTRDAKVSSKRWKNRFYRDVEFKQNNRGIKNCLTNFMKLAGMPAHTYLRPATARIRYVIAQIEKRDSYDELTPVAKAKWTKLLSHNERDGVGTREVLVTECEDMERI